MRVCLHVFAIVALFCLGSNISADTVTFNATEDTTIYSNVVNNSGGGHAFNIAGRARNGNERRTLLRFDLSGIAPGSTVSTAQLDLNVLEVGNTGGNFELFRVDTDWGEGTQIGNQGAAAQSGDATWDSAEFGSVNWATPGGTFFTPVLSSTNITTVGTRSFTNTLDFTSAIQAMIDDPTQNFGFLISSSDNNSAIRIDSREGGGAASLVLHIKAVPEPTTLPILLFGLTGLSFIRSRKRLI